MTAETHYFEDIEVGATAEFGEYHVTATEIDAFTERFGSLSTPPDVASGDDPAVAPGWLVATICMRITHDWPGHQGSSLAGAGLDAVRWHQPVHAGDTLRLRTEVLETRASESQPDRGYSRSRWEALDQDGTVVLSFVIEEVWPRRPGGDE